MGRNDSKQQRVGKTLEQKVLDLDAHLFLLRTHLRGLRDSASHLKAIAAELRTLVCRSSGTEGLLYRLIQEMGVDDLIHLHVPGKVRQDHPLFKNLEFLIAPIFRGGQGPEQIKPMDHSFRAVIRTAEALVAKGRPLTHEYLIKAVAQQMGSAHEDEGIEPALAQLSSIFINGVEPFVQVLAFDAEMALEIGERVLEEAVRRGIFQRRPHGPDDGNLTIAVRVELQTRLTQSVQLFRVHAFGPATSISGFAEPAGVKFVLTKQGASAKELRVPYAQKFATGDAGIFALSYCSRAALVRTIAATGAGEPVHCPLGWLYGEGLQATVEHSDKALGRVRLLTVFERLLSTSDVRELQSLPPDGRGLWVPEEELEARGPFPT